MHDTYHASTQADGHADDLTFTLPSDLARAIAPTPWTADDVTVRDADGRAVVGCLSFDLPGMLPTQFATARANAIRIAQAVNAEESRANAITAAKLSGRHQALYEVALCLDRVYRCAPIEDCCCMLCGADMAVGHADDCPIHDLSDALAVERDGKGWNL